MMAAVRRPKALNINKVREIIYKASVVLLSKIVVKKESQSRRIFRTVENLTKDVIKLRADQHFLKEISLNVSLNSKCVL